MELETETLVGPETERLLQMATQADAERAPGQPEPSAPEPEPRAPGREEDKPPVIETDDGTKPPISSETEPETPEAKEEKRLRDEKGRFQAKETKKEEKPETEPPKDTDYERAKKEQVRKDRTWQQIEAEKAEVRAEKARIDEEKRLSALQRTGQPLPPVLKDGYSLEDYWGAYQDFKKNGDHENAAKSLETVMEIQNYTARAIQQQQEAAHELAFRSDMEEAIKSEPDLAKPETPIAQEVQKILSEYPEIYYLPKGFQKTIELAKLRLEAASVSELRDELIKVRAELERRDRQSQPAKGGPTVQPSRRSLDDMSLDEREAELLRRAEAADAGIAA